MLIKEKKITSEKAKSLLLSSGLSVPGDIDYTAGFFHGSLLIGTGSVSGNILKGIAVHEDYRGENITAKIITHLASVCLKKGFDNFFIFTKFSEKDKFEDLGFNTVGSVRGQAALLEYDRNGIKRFTEGLEKLSSGLKGNNSCIVMNCNPFTKGHLYLIEKAASESEYLFIIIVQEDRSLFPFEKRIELVRKGTEHLNNITVLPGGSYTISSATFPSYFVKEDRHTDIFASLDLDIFINHTAKALNIKKRFIGEEPYCPVTSIYNRYIKSLLPEAGIEAVEIERIKTGNEIISASKVRSLIREGKIEETEKYLPPSTYSFLISCEAGEIIDKIKNSSSRH